MTSQPNQSLISGLAVLTRVCAATEALGGRELAREMGLHPATVNRLLMTLCDLGIVRRDPQRRYLPAAGLHVLAALAGHGSGLLRRAQPVLRELHDAYPQAILAIGVAWQEQVAYLYHARAASATTDALPRLLPRQRSSIGTVLATGQRYAADIHDDHRSIAVPIDEHGHAVAALAISAIPLSYPIDPLVDRLQAAVRRIADAP